MIKRKWLTRILCVLLASTVLLPYIPAEAIYFDGSSGGNAEGTTVKGDTNLQDLDAVIAYRFTGLNADGSQKGDSSLDIYLVANLSAELTTWSSSSGVPGAYDKALYYFGSRYSKKDYADAYSDSGMGISDSTTRLAFNGTSIIKETDMEFWDPLPSYPGSIGAWCLEKENINPIAKYFGWDSASAVTDGASIIVEPIYGATLGGTRCCLTVSELAALGMSYFGSDSFGNATTDNISSSDGSKWGNVSRYINLIWPCSLYSTQNDYWWPAAWDQTAKGTHLWQKNIPGVPVLLETDQFPE